MMIQGETTLARRALWVALLAVALAAAGCAVDERHVGLSSGASPNDTVDVGVPTLRAGRVLETASASFDFGEAALGVQRSGVLVVGNTGDQPILGLTAQIEGEFAADFTVALPSECAELLRRASCSVNLTFTPSAPGDRSARLVLTGIDANVLEVQLLGRGPAGSSSGSSSGSNSGSGGADGSAGTGATPGGFMGNVNGTSTLSDGFAQDITSIAFGGAEVTSTIVGPLVTLRNASAATGPLRVDNDNPSNFLVSSDCAAPLATGAGCQVSVRFKPAGLGDRSGTIVVTDGARRALLSVSGRGQYLLKVVRDGSAPGRVTGPGGMDCGETCSVLLEPGFVLLSARTENGSDSFFSGWSGSHCTGTGRNCDFQLTFSATVNATFAAQTNNLVFLSSEAFPSTLGSAESFDAGCNRLATSAGVNTAAGNGFVAAVSGPETFWDRIPPSTRGWVRMDGLPFGDLRERMAADPPELYYTVQFDELGRKVPPGFLWTGTARDGSSPSNCSNWTAPADGSLAPAGLSQSLPGWLLWSNFSCNGQSLPVYCMGTTKTAPLTLPQFSGKRIWVSDTIFEVGGSLTPDQKCQSERPPGVADARALIAYTGHPLAEALDLTATYVRPDGQLVGTGAQIAGFEMVGVPWISANGSVANEVNVWTGQAVVLAAPTAQETCSDWSDPASTGLFGASGANADLSFSSGGNLPRSCQFSGRLYCIEP
ncbi:MAG: choice-of-anchor D domain-containing protein [Deltaproteobacteria bacterium]